MSSLQRQTSRARDRGNIETARGLKDKHRTPSSAERLRGDEGVSDAV